MGFADLVGSSTLTHQLSTGELGKAFAEFDAQASDAVTARGGRVVKLIGDAVMFVASTGVVACNIALCLAEVFAEHEVLPPVRCGVAAGDVVARDGDYYGLVVNLAVRACAAAGPGEVLVAGAVRDQLAESSSTLRLGPIQSNKLKGLDEPVELFKIQQTPDDDSGRGLTPAPRSQPGP